MNVACSSATFGLQVAHDLVRAGSARRVLVVNPEVCSSHLNFRDRDSHFIFGDACTAVVVERGDEAQGGFDVLGTKVLTSFSNNIRNNFGFLNRARPEGIGQPDKLFVQEGRKVFKEVVPMVSAVLKEHLGALGIAPSALSRLWLHQANKPMNEPAGVMLRVPHRGPATATCSPSSRLACSCSTSAPRSRSCCGCAARPGTCACCTRTRPRAGGVKAPIYWLYLGGLAFCIAFAQFLPRSMTSFDPQRPLWDHAFHGAWFAMGVLYALYAGAAGIFFAKGEDNQDLSRGFLIVGIAYLSLWGNGSSLSSSQSESDV